MPFEFSVVLDADSPDAGVLDDTIDAILGDLVWADDTFSLWRDDTPMSRVSRGELAVDEAPPAIGEVLAACDRYREATGGAFDARKPDGSLDPTGIVKTWAVERARWRLDQIGARDWMIGASGDVIVSGSAPGGKPWRLGIADPRRSEDPSAGPVLDVVDLGGDNRALCSSGTAQHGQHLWNPSSGEMAAAYVQVSVVGDDLVDCDAWATAIAVGGEDVLRAAAKHGLEALAIRAAANGEPVSAQATAGWPSVPVPER